jgi:hypothetical protein
VLAGKRITLIAVIPAVLAIATSRNGTRTIQWRKKKIDSNCEVDQEPFFATLSQFETQVPVFVEKRVFAGEKNSGREACINEVIAQSGSCKLLGLEDS